MFGVSGGSEVDFRRVDALLTEDNCVLEDMFYAVGGGGGVVVCCPDHTLPFYSASPSRIPKSPIL